MWNYPCRCAALVDEAKALYTEYLDTPAEPAPLLDFVGERLSIEPEESDVVHDLLAHLAERMIILVKNRKKLKDRYDPKSPTNYRHLQEWYEDSVDKLQPRMGRIEATDRLIDQIVYRWWAD